MTRRQAWDRSLEAVEAAMSTVDLGDCTTSHRRKRAAARIDELAERLKLLRLALDPTLRPISSFDPSRPGESANLAAMKLLAQPAWPLGDFPDFYGSGVYAIYYTGAFDPYQPISGTAHPIYVGSAKPPAGAITAEDQGKSLATRLKKHAGNIRVAQNLDVDDFECRFLIVQTGYELAIEDRLIGLFMPIWNKESNVCLGFGKHGDDAETRANGRSPWDTMHPGRLWALATRSDQKSKEVIEDEIAAHFVARPPVRDIDHAVTELTGGSQFAGL